MANLKDKSRSRQMGMHSEQIGGRSQQMFFQPDEAENLAHPYAYDVDVKRKSSFDAANMETPEVNLKIRELMADGVGSITIKNPSGKHSLGVGILNRLNLTFEGSVGYFAAGLIDGPNVKINGRVGWSCGENMMAGTVVIKKNAGSQFGAAIRGGDLVCHGSVGGRTGINQKGGTIIVGGDTGAFTGFMMQRGRMIILGDAHQNLGDSMYDGTIYIGGNIESFGVDAVEGELTDLDVDWLGHKVDLYGLKPSKPLKKFKKVVAGKQLWNYDNLEPSEKKLVL